MEKIDKAEYEKRLARINAIFADIADHAMVQSLTRCPYKNRFDRCTAKFGCQNKRPPRDEDPLPVCGGDDKIDYRPAWDSDPASLDEMRRTLHQAADMAHKQTAATVTFDDCSAAIESGKTIFDYADELAVRVPTSCGRNGSCHECIVDIKRGMEALSPRTAEESFLTENYRLACQARIVETDQDVEFALLRRTPKILRGQAGQSGEIDPIVTRRGDHVYYGEERIDEYRGSIHGIAIDVGTTTVVFELVDLESGESLYSAAFENPQRFGGSDVMNRISYDGGTYQGELHRAMINTLNTEIRRTCDELSIARNTIYEIVVVANSTMRELFFDLDVQPIGQKPYKSPVEEAYLAGERETTALTAMARSLSIVLNKQARVYGAPLIASHVGADVTADLLAIDMPSQTDVVMLVDAGTNTEVVIGHRDRLIAASCPAGPAFEGGLVTYGMPGCDGAIESLKYDNGIWKTKVIGDSDPVGMCGSGLIDLLAELRRHDLMTEKGVFRDKAMQLEIVPQRGITFSRRDASELAQAKAANYCGQIILMRKFGVSPEQISRLYLAGGFANYVDSDSAIDIGFLAPVPRDRIVKVGNAAVDGARQMLLSQTRRREIDALVRSIEHVELETMSDFFEQFVEGCQFKPMHVAEWEQA